VVSPTLKYLYFFISSELYAIFVVVIFFERLAIQNSPFLSLTLDGLQVSTGKQDGKQRLPVRAVSAGWLHTHEDLGATLSVITVLRGQSCHSSVRI